MYVEVVHASCKYLHDSKQDYSSILVLRCAQLPHGSACGTYSFCCFLMCAATRRFVCTYYITLHYIGVKSWGPSEGQQTIDYFCEVCLTMT